MASDDKWSGLLVVIVLVAIFSITSVCGMSIYFFCKCTRKKKKRQRVRPAPNGNHESHDNDENDDDEENDSTPRNNMSQGINWITSTNSRTERSCSIGETYLAPRNKNASKGDYAVPRRVSVGGDGIYDSSKYKSKIHSKKSNRVKANVSQFDICNTDTNTNEMYQREYSKYMAINQPSPRLGVGGFKMRNVFSVDGYDEIYDTQPNKIREDKVYCFTGIGNTACSENIGKKDASFSEPQLQQPGDVSKTDDSFSEIHPGGIFTRPKKVKVRKSPRSSDIVAETVFDENGKTGSRNEEIKTEDTTFDKRGPSRTCSHTSTPKFVFTASSKMAWTLDP